MRQQNIIKLSEISRNDIADVGGKNASLGEMIGSLSRVGIRVPDGFAITAYAYAQFLNANGLNTDIEHILAHLDVDDISALTQAGAHIREKILQADLGAQLESDIRAAYQQLVGNHTNISFAVRSSATAEDLPDASFAGQQETFLNISGINNILVAVRHVFASLFNDRAIAYRTHQGYAQTQVMLSVGVQRMVRSDVGVSGVMFSIDTETGFKDAVLITSAYGLGEAVVQGSVNPDEFYLYKPNVLKNQLSILSKTCGSKAVMMTFTQDLIPGRSVQTVEVPAQQRAVFSLTDQELMELAKYAILIETHYGCPMDIEWAKDGITGELWIVQARPETVNSQSTRQQSMVRYVLSKKSEHPVVTGRAIGQKIGSGTVKILTSIAQMHQINAGDVLVTDMTDPDWEPIMRKASAIVTNRGGRTCHAAIIARELGIPAVVGCGNATQVLTLNQTVTVCCAEGEVGAVYPGMIPFEIDTIVLNAMPNIKTKMMMNVASPDKAFGFQALPNAGVGLARLEFIINQMIGIHPHAVLDYQQLAPDLRKQIDLRIQGYPDPVEFYISKLTQGIAMIAAAFAPKPVIVRLSDFKSNEYAHLLGGESYEPMEENPMIGFRGASRYIDPKFKACFELECQALKRVRLEMGLSNVQVMVPFVRTLPEAKAVVDLLAHFGLKRGENGLKLIMMCEIPSNVILAEAFLEHFDGFSIGSNDLTQLTLGIDRDSALVSGSFDERDPAVLTLIDQVISVCKQKHKYIGICGQGPSDHPDFAVHLLNQGIDSLSLNPDAVIDTWMKLARTEAVET
jgi:pyruvate,water dikinase